MGANYSFYVKFIATRAPTFFGYIISVLASVNTQSILDFCSTPADIGSFHKYHYDGLQQAVFLLKNGNMWRKIFRLLF